MTICFNQERKDRGECYYWSVVKCMTFRFEPDVYYIGFSVDPNSFESNHKFMLYQEYNVDYFFPSILERTISNFENTIKHDILIHSGEIIGKAKVEDWVFV
jgi:hypothetical protein